MFYIINSKKRDIPWNWLNVLKILVTVALLVLSVVDLGTAINSTKDEDVANVDIYTPVIKILTFVSMPICYFVFSSKKIHGPF